MMAFILAGVTLFYIVYLPVYSVLWELFVGLPMLLWWRMRGIPLDAAARRHNELYGRWMVRGSWPLLRVRLKGRENMPRGRPVVVVANHRSFIDIFMYAMVATPNTVVMVRSWPFRMFVLQWFMRLARYVDIERTPMEELLEKQAPHYLKEGSSFLFFPEGHRSRDGRLQPFRSGAFRLAERHGLPVVPVCIQGTESLTHPRWPVVRPTRITIEVLPPVDPATLPEENRMMKLKRAVEQVFKAHLGE